MLAILRQILAFILTNLGLSQQIVGIVTGIDTTVQNLAAHATYETTPYYIQDRVVASLGDLENITYGLNALHTQLTAIQTAIANIPTTGTPVTLPTTPPTGYGGGTGATAADVWAYPSPSTGHTAIDTLDDAGIAARNLANMAYQVPVATSRFFGVTGNWGSTYGTNNASSDPNFPTDNILSTDTLLTFLERESGWTGWLPNASGFYTVNQNGTSSPWNYICTISPNDFITLRDAGTPPGALLVPPVWPGVANITASDMVDLAAFTEFDGPMDGVIIGLFSVPANLPHYTYGTTTAYGHLGALAFVDDNGQAEQFQAIQFHDQVLCPKTMHRAYGVVWRVTPGLAGGITPWTINS